MGCGASKSLRSVGRFSLEDGKDGHRSAAPSISGSVLSIQSQASVDFNKPLSSEAESRLHIVRENLKTFQGTCQFFDDDNTVTEDCMEASTNLARIVSESIAFYDDVKTFNRKIGKIYMETNTISVQCKLISLLTAAVCDHSEDVHGSYWLTLRVQLSSFRNLTYFDPEFASKTCECGLLASMADLLKFLYIQYTSKDTPSKRKEALMGLIQCGLSISNHCAAAGSVTKPFYDRLNYSQILIPYLQIDNDQTKTETIFCLAYILDEENNDVFSSNREHISYLLKTLKITLQDDVSLSFTGWTPDVLARGIARMANNDQNKKLLMDEGILSLLITMSKMSQVNCVLSATNLMWTLSFHPDNRQKMVSDAECMRNIKILSKSSHRKVRKAAKGCLWTLGRNLVSQPKDKKLGGKEMKPVPVQSQQQHLMISYSWDKKQTIYKIKNELTGELPVSKAFNPGLKVPTPSIHRIEIFVLLRTMFQNLNLTAVDPVDYLKAGYVIWLDVEQMEGSTLEAMASAVEGAAVVLVCVSEKYKKSNNCRAEAEYAFQKKKEIIPLMMEKYEPDGWLGIILGTKKFYDFSGKYSFNSRIEGLLQELRDKGRSAVEQTTTNTVQKDEVVPISSQPTLTTKGKVSSWTVEDVQHWIKDIQLDNDGAFDTIDGRQLSFLLLIRNQAPEFYFQYLQKNLRLENLRDMMLFDEQLRTLH